jgi:molybdopterin-synthase adenylyltransferase
LQRYKRNIDLIGIDGQKKLASAKILVCGCGGLGSNIIANLSALGIGQIGLIDNDNVEISNLNRQFIHNNPDELKVNSAKNFINKFNPQINVNTYPIRLNENNYQNIVKDYDIIIDCFDEYNSKFLLNKIALKTNLPLIHAGVAEFSGQVMTIIPHKTACLECIIENKHVVEIPKGILSPIVSTIASIQSTEVVKLILNIGDNLQNKLLTYNALTYNFKIINLEKNSYCKACK